MTDTDTSPEAVERLAAYLDKPGQGLVSYNAAATLRALSAKLEAERACAAESAEMYRRARDRADVWKRRSDAQRARAESAEAERDALKAENVLLREAGDEMAESVEHGFISDGVTIWDNTRAALEKLKP